MLVAHESKIPNIIISLVLWSSLAVFVNINRIHRRQGKIVPFPWWACFSIFSRSLTLGAEVSDHFFERFCGVGSRLKRAG